MKSSRYNYIFHKDRNSYFYNGLNHTYFRCSRGLGEKIQAFLSNPQDYEILNESFQKYLQESGFIVENKVKEIDAIRNHYESSTNSKVCFLIINPTLNCNFSCPYCVQDHIPSRMSEETIEKIKRHVDYEIEKEGITSFILEWFGGEPFLYFNEVIKPISEYAKKRCEEASIPFHNGATTNASLISSEIAAQLYDLSFYSFQITIDGDKKLHNTIKFSNDIASAFDCTLNNIVSILEYNPECRVILRINYTSVTLESNIVEEVCEIIPKILRSRIKILLKKVWQEEVDNSRFKNYQSLLDDFKLNGFNVERLDIIRNFMPCNVNKRYYRCINYDGGVIKCTNCDLLYSKNPPGKLTETGEVVWTNQFDERNSEPSFENERCLTCRFLPICMSHCPKNHLAGTTNICKLQSVDMDLKAAIIAYIDDMYETTKE